MITRLHVGALCVTLVVCCLSVPVHAQPVVSSSPVADRPGMKPFPAHLMSGPAAKSEIAIDAYRTFIGGSGTDLSLGIHETRNGDLIVGLQTTSPDLVTTKEAEQDSLLDEAGDTYFIRFTPETGEAVWATYFGTPFQDWLFDMICDEELGLCVAAGATLGDLAGTGKSGGLNTSATVTHIDMDNGQILNVHQLGNSFDYGFNAISRCQTEDPLWVASGFRNTADGLDAIWCRFNSETGETELFEPTASGDQSLFDGLCLEEWFLGVGASDPEGTGDLEPPKDPLLTYGHFGTGNTDVFTLPSSISDFLNNITGDGEQIIATKANDATEQTPSTNDLFCMPGPHICPPENLNQPECGGNTQSLGNGFPLGLETDAANNVWSSHDFRDEQNNFQGTGEFAFFPQVNPPCGDPFQFAMSNAFPFGNTFVGGYQPKLFSTTFSGAAFGGFFEPTPGSFQPTCPGQAACGSAAVVPAETGYLQIFNFDPNAITFTFTLTDDLGQEERQETLEQGDASSFLMTPGGTDWSLSIPLPDPFSLNSTDIDNDLVIVLVDPNGNPLTFGVDDVDNNAGIFVNATENDVDVEVSNFESGETLDEFSIPAGDYNRWSVNADVRANQWHFIDPVTNSPEAVLLFSNNLAEVLIAAINVELGSNVSSQRDPTSAKRQLQGIEVTVVDAAGQPIDFTVVTDTEEEVPTGSGLEIVQNFPNPFSNATRIEFSLAEVEDVRLEVIDLLGRRVTTLLDRQLPAGSHAARWNVGSDIAPGIYMYRLTTDDESVTGQMVVN